LQFCDTGLSHDGKIQAEILPTIAFRGRPGPIYVEGLDLLRQDFTIKNAKTFVGTVMERMYIVEWLTRQGESQFEPLRGKLREEPAVSFHTRLRRRKLFNAWRTVRGIIHQRSFCPVANGRRAGSRAVC
jgi:hypothetical protein